MKEKEIFKLIEEEVKRADDRYFPFRSNHEGISVLREEFEELWDEIKLSKNVIGNKRMQEEAVQVAAMAVKFIRDLC